MISDGPGLEFGFTYAETDLGTMATGSAQTVETAIFVDYLAPGTHWIAAFADPYGALDELDETDNLTGWIPLVVEAPTYNLSLDGAFVTPGSDPDLNGGATLNLEFDVTNHSNLGPPITGSPPR